MLAERAASLENLQNQRRNVFNLAQRSQNQAFGKDVDQGLLDEDDMGVRVGDNVSHHYHAPSEPPKKPQSSNNLLPLLLAGLLGVGAALAADKYFGDKDTDTDTLTELEIYRPKE